MKPTIGKRAVTDKKPQEKPPSAARDFIVSNTHRNLTIKREYVYIEDVRVALNINSLEERLQLKRWLVCQLKADIPLQQIIKLLADSADRDRHRLVKDYKVRS